MVLLVLRLEKLSLQRLHVVIVRQLIQIIFRDLYLVFGLVSLRRVYDIPII